MVKLDLQKLWRLLEKVYTIIIFKPWQKVFSEVCITLLLLFNINILLIYLVISFVKHKFKITQLNLIR